MKTCSAAFKFGDDYGDNPCTFHCQRVNRHAGKHSESGVLAGEKWIVIWSDDNARSVKARLSAKCRTDAGAPGARSSHKQKPRKK